MSKSGEEKVGSKTFGHNVQKWRAKKRKQTLDIMSRSEVPKRESKPLDIMSKSEVSKKGSKTFGHNVQKWRSKKERNLWT